KLNTLVGANALGSKAEFGTEILAKTDLEVSSTAEKALNAVSTASLSETIEEEYTDTHTGGQTLRVAQYRRRYRRRKWDFYLHSYQYVDLIYKTPWYWVNQRDARTSAKVLGLPLASVVFYEPQDRLEACFDAVDELPDPDAVEVTDIAGTMPNI